MALCTYGLRASTSTSPKCENPNTQLFKWFFFFCYRKSHITTITCARTVRTRHVTRRAAGHSSRPAKYDGGAEESQGGPGGKGGPGGSPLVSYHAPRAGYAELIITTMTATCVADVIIVSSGTTKYYINALYRKTYHCYSYPCRAVSYTVIYDYVRAARVFVGRRRMTDHGHTDGGDDGWLTAERRLLSTLPMP